MGEIGNLDEAMREDEGRDDDLDRCHHGVPFDEECEECDDEED